MTTEESTMMAPTERSMPAVRMTSDWAARQDADDLHLLQDQRQRKGREEFLPEQHAEDEKRPTRTISGTSEGVCVQPMLECSTKPCPGCRIRQRWSARGRGLVIPAYRTWFPPQRHKA
jgi:hypothetical protein